MGRIKELQEKVAKGLASAEEITELDALKAEAKEVADVETKAVAEEEAAVERLASQIADKAMENLTAKLEAGVKEEKKEEAPKKAVTSKTVIVDRTYGKMTPDQLDDIKEEIAERKSAGKKHTSISQRTKHFMNALITGDVQKLQILTEGSPAGGGYLVPEDFMNMIVEDLRDATVMRQIGSVMTTTTDTVHLPKLDTRPKAAWRSEAAVKNTSTAQFSELVFTPYSLASIVTLSQELADDATLGVGGSVVNYIAGLITQALAEEEDSAFFIGNGTGKPTGISTYTIGSRAKSANLADDVIELFHDLKQGYRGRAVWVGNARTLATVRQLKDTQNRYLVQNLGDSPYGSLLGRPMYEQNNLSNELYVGDFSYYQIVDRQGISVRVSDEATVGGSSAFEKNLVHVRVEKRTDGELTLTEALKKITGV